MKRIGWQAVVAATWLVTAGIGALNAQTDALVTASSNEPLIEYSRNESGGRVSLTFPRSDSTNLEHQRLRVLEFVAAIRRGDFRSVPLFSDHPALQILAARRAELRCTMRSTNRGIDLVLLSDDNAVVAAIHQLLSAPPPRLVRL